MTARITKIGDVDVAIAAYGAGLVDGEATIGIRRACQKRNKSRISYSLRLCIQMCDTEGIESLAKQFGGLVLPVKLCHIRHKQQFHWSLWGRRAASFLTVIQPHIKLKRESVQLALEFQSIQEKRLAKCKVGLSVGDVTIAESFKINMANLNATRGFKVPSKSMIQGQLSLPSRTRSL